MQPNAYDTVVLLVFSDMLCYALEKGFIEKIMKVQADGGALSSK